MKEETSLIGTLEPSGYNIRPVGEETCGVAEFALSRVFISLFKELNSELSKEKTVESE